MIVKIHINAALIQFSHSVPNWRDIYALAFNIPKSGDCEVLVTRRCSGTSLKQVWILGDGQL